MFGRDLSCSDDCRLDMGEVTDLALLAEAVVRRLTTPRGMLLGDPDYGLDLRLFLSRGMTRVQREAIPGLIRQEILKDERIARVDVTIKQLTGEVLDLLIRCDTGLGPFSLELSVSAARVLFATATLSGTLLTMVTQAVTDAAAAQAALQLAPFQATDVAGCVGWWRGDYGVERLSGIPAIHGEAAQFWRDRTVQLRHVSQATSTKRPILNTSGGVNGHPFLRFDGADDWLRGTWTQAQPLTRFVVAVIERDAGDSGVTLCDGATDIIQRLYIGSGSPGDVRISAGTEIGAGGATVTQTAIHRFVAVYNEASSSITVDDVSHGTGNAGAGTAGGLIIGAQGSQVAGFASADVYEIIEYYGALSAPDLALVNTYLKNRYGV